MLGCCWPPDTGGGGGTVLSIGVTPIIGGSVGDQLTVGAGGVLDEIPIGSGFLPLAGGLMTGAAPIQWHGNTSMLRLRGTPNGTGFGPEGWLSLHTFDVNGAGNNPDPTMTLGMNLIAGDSLVDPNYGGIGISMEGFFKTATEIQELRLVYVPKASSGHPSVRAISIGGNQNNGATTLGLSADVITWFDGLGAQQGTLTAGVHVTDGAFRSSTYGSVLLEQLNSLGTVHANLFVLANGFVDGQPDRLAIGVGGAVSRTQIYKGTDFYSFDSSVAPVLGLFTSTGPSAPLHVTVDVDTFDPNVVLSRNPGSLYVRVLGGGSSLYINRSATTPGTAWSIVTAIP